MAITGHAVERFLGLGFLAWLALYCGRPTWGAALYAFGITRDVPLHRLIGGVHLFGILLAGLALGRGAAWLAERRRAGRWLAPAAALLLLLPAAAERVHFIRQGMVWLRASEAAMRAAAPELAALHQKLVA